MDKTRDNLVKLLSGFLSGGLAHITFEDAVKDIPLSCFGTIPENLPYSLWQEISHIRIAQKDILEFCINPNYESPSWPEGYWPSSPSPENKKAWNSCIKQILSDRVRFIELIKDHNNDLFEPLPHGNGQNLIREAILIIDHTSYHVGQIILIRRLLGIYHH